MGVDRGHYIREEVSEEPVETSEEASPETAQTSEDASVEPEQASAADDSAASSDTTGSKMLVAYYSASGNTKRIAEYIADQTGGDLFEITPTAVYTEEDLNWSDSNSRVTQEHENESERNVPLVADTVDNWADYDTVFIGYPIDKKVN